jgi:hypothetical protein
MARMTTDCPYRRKAAELLTEAKATADVSLRTRLIHRASVWHQMSLMSEHFPSEPAPQQPELPLVLAA